MELTQADYTLIRDRLLAHFSIEELERMNWLEREFDLEARRSLGRLDLQFFARFYLKHHFTDPPARLHDDIFTDIETMVNSPGPRYEVMAVFRGAGKSTIDTLALPIWCVAYGLRHYIPIISDSNDQAKQHLSSIKSEFDTNQRILEDFGALRGVRWQEEDIETANFCKVQALGQGMKFLGRKYHQWRPDLIVLDDIENPEDILSETQRRGLESWFKTTVMRAGATDVKILMVGTLRHHECLIAKMFRNPRFVHRRFAAIESWAEREDLWEQWRQVITDLSHDNPGEVAHKFYAVNQTEMMRGVKVAWPERFPYEQLMVSIISDGPSSFSTEMQNEPDDPAARFFQHYGTYKRMPHRNEDGTYEEWLIPWDSKANEGMGAPSGKTPIPLAACALFAATDPSMGESTSSDRSAILIGAVAPNNQIFLLEADIKRRLPDRIIVDQTHWMETYPGILAWGIEAVQFQKFFGTVSARESQEAGAKIPVVPLSTHNNLKEMRIQTLQPDLLNEYILLNEDGQHDLKDEIARYRPGIKASTKIDGLDALEMLRSLCDDNRPKMATSITFATTHEYGQTKIAELMQQNDDYAFWDAVDREADERAYINRQAIELALAAKEHRKPREIKGAEKMPFFPISIG